MSADVPWPKMPSVEDMINAQPMMGQAPRKVPDFTKFVYPLIRNPSPEQAAQAAQEAAQHTALWNARKENERTLGAIVRCPGCCGPAFASFFEGYDYGPAMKKGDYHSFTCGESYIKIGPHGSLAYVEVSDKRPVQQAIDERFAERQRARQQDLVEFLASGAESVTFTRGCGTVVTYVPKGPLPATTHGVDCKCKTVA
jgi:hypothetical protein